MRDFFNFLNESHQALSSFSPQVIKNLTDMYSTKYIINQKRLIIEANPASYESWTWLNLANIIISYKNETFLEYEFKF